MTHTSTGHPDALMKLADDYAEACFDQALYQRTTDDKPEAAREKLEKELRLLHARVQELEASQAQRLPLSESEVDDLWEGATGGHSFTEETRRTFVRSIEQAHGITQEKQG